MAVMWKRINDIGKNWRHVYKTLSDFQYIDSSGRDQGQNVRRKSQCLVLLVNVKERVLEVRQKADANRDKFRGSSSVGGKHRPSSYSGSRGYGDRYDDDPYGSRYEEREGYGRERGGGYRDDGQYGHYVDSYSRDGNWHSRDSDERDGRDSYRDGGYQGRSPKIDDYQYGSRSADRDRYCPYDNDDHQSSRENSVRTENHPPDRRPLERKSSEQSVGAPHYEEAVRESTSSAYYSEGYFCFAVSGHDFHISLLHCHPTLSCQKGWRRPESISY